MSNRWCIPVNGDWFYGTREQCIREREEYESTFSDLDREEAGVVLPERVYSGNEMSSPARLKPVGYRCRFFKEPDKWMVNWDKPMPDQYQRNPNAEYQQLYAEQPA